MHASRYQPRLCGVRYKKAPLTKADVKKDENPPCSLLYSFQETVREDPSGKRKLPSVAGRMTKLT